MPADGPNINDVARRAGVSRSSVSRYLNGRPVRRSEQIITAIEELGFEPSPIARSLRAGRTSSVGVIVADVSNPFFAAAFRGIESVARRQVAPERLPIQLLLCNTDERVDRLLELLDGLSGRVDGLIIAPPVETEPPDAILRLKDTIVLLDRVFSGPPIADAVLVDNVGGVIEAVGHLTALGHQRIGFISGPEDTTPGRQRLEGYLAGLRAAGLQTQDDLVTFGDFRESGGARAAAQLLDLSSPPTAIICANNLMSLGALAQLARNDILIPTDIAFVAFDDLATAELLRPSITTVSRPMRAQGAQAMELLEQRLRGARHPPVQVVLPARLRPRGSSGPPGTGRKTLI